MNVYFVCTKWEHSGFYVVAETPGKAKSWCLGEISDDYTELRAYKQKVDPSKLANLKPCIINIDDEWLLKKLNIAYAEGEEV